MRSTPRTVREFDAIAAALDACPSRDALSAAERALLRHVPADARTALDVGCGHGVVSRALARLAAAVAPGGRPLVQDVGRPHARHALVNAAAALGEQ